MDQVSPRGGLTAAGDPGGTMPENSGTLHSRGAAKRFPTRQEICKVATDAANPAMTNRSALNVQSTATIAGHSEGYLCDGDN